MLNPLFFALKQKSTSSKYIKNSSNNPLTFSKTSLLKTKHDPSAQSGSDKDLLVDIVENKMKFLVEKEGYHGEYTLVKTTGIDVHVMNKSSLLRVIEGGQGV